MFAVITEVFIDTVNLSFNECLNKKTGYEIDIFENFFKKVDNIIAKGKISTDTQFFEVNNFVTGLNHQGIKDKRSKILNRFMEEYYSKKKV
jgi:hypothetical protein